LRSFFSTWPLTIALAVCPSAAVSGAEGPPVDYSRSIRPILSNNCFRCHGPDAGERKAGLRLDRREVALQALKNGKRAIVPGNPGASALLARIHATDPDEVMPPPSTGKKLSPEEKALLARWIAKGAEYRDHWAFIRPRRPVVPAVKAESWPRGDIDRFILALMEAQGLSPSPEADRTALIRRLTLDLTGLPPAPDEVDAFLADKWPDAYERLVERLFRSPHHGERMALEWLDAARFADTHGYHIDSGRDMTRWRKWVIDAYAQNLPFDRFTIEQLAGDLLPGATDEERIASGFHRNHMINFEGGAIPEEYHTAYIVDRVNTTGTVWLGLTIACAQCHDHKYDPFTQKEYYRLFAFFHNVPENGLDGSKGNAAPLIRMPSPEEEESLARLSTRIAEMEEKAKSPPPEAVWAPIEPVDLRSTGGAVLTRIEDGSIVASGENAAAETYSIAARATVQEVTALRVEVLPDERLPANGPGRSPNGNIVLTEVRLAVSDPPRPLAFKEASADFSQEKFPVAGAIDGKPETGWAIYPSVGKPHAAVLELGEPLAADETARLSVSLEFRSQFAQHQPGKFRLSVTGSANPHGKNPIGDELKKLRQEREAVEKRIPTAMVMQEMEKPRDTFVLIRGAYDKRGEKVGPGVPDFLPPLPEGTRADRLALARWLVDPAHPLTARVIVNRYWQVFFGTALVKTSEDFGSQGEPPSHPELLDWLAVEFIESGWDTRALLRRMVTSAAYRQSSRAAPALIEHDPENRLLARGPRFRLPAEFIRDQALAASGLLDRRIGGASVSPYQPPGIWEELASRSDGANWTAQTYTQSRGADLYRRTMYTFWKRTAPPPTLATFDAPDRETCTVRRARTNTPLQALILLNDPTYVEAARKLAERALTEIRGGPVGTEERVVFAFRLVLARRPSAAEASVLARILESEREAYRRDRAAAIKLLSVGESPRREDLDPAEWAAWTVVASAILNLDETLTRG